MIHTIAHDTNRRSDMTRRRSGVYADGEGGAASAAPVKEPEPKDVRFRRLAIRRVNGAVKRILAVGNLANRASYEYTDEQASQVLGALQDAVDAVINAFTAKAASKPTFQFKE